MSWGSAITTAGKLLALVPGVVEAGKAIAGLFGRKKPDPKVAASQRTQVAAGEAARRESRIAGSLQTRLDAKLKQSGKN